MYGEKEVKLPLFTGHVARGILLNAIRHVDPATSQKLHEPNLRKAYAVTPLRFRSKAKTGDGYIYDPAYPCRMGVRFLADEYTKLLLRCFEAKPTFLIYDTTFEIATIKVKSISYQDLWERKNCVEAFRLYFQTPTCFAALGRKYYYLFPEPKRVFSNLLNLWNQYSNDKLEGEEKENYLRWLGREMGVSGYFLETQFVTTNKGRVAGFKGFVTYRTQFDDTWQRMTDCLAKFAEYSNVGKDRTSGFGVINYEARDKVTK